MKKYGEKRRQLPSFSPSEEVITYTKNNKNELLKLSYYENELKC